MFNRGDTDTRNKHSWLGYSRVRCAMCDRCFFVKLVIKRSDTDLGTTQIRDTCYKYQLSYYIVELRATLYYSIRAIECIPAVLFLT